MIWNSTVEEIVGDDAVTGVVLKDVQTNTTSKIDADGVFIAVGIIPNSNEFTGKLAVNNEGYIVAGEDCRTSIPGVYAAGDVREKQLRQIVTAVADGANAVTGAQKFISVKG